MIKICLVVPKIKKNNFTGGIYSILKHADGLARMGHSVSVVPLYNSELPDWFEDYKFNLQLINKWKVAWLTFKGKHEEKTLESRVHSFTSALFTVEPRFFPFSMRHSIMCERARHLLPDADITIATSFETALPVCLYGKGVLAYYAQHFEPFFSNEFDDSEYARVSARASYYLPLKIITNSSWLEKTIRSETGVVTHAVAGNAIEDAMFSEKAISPSTEAKLLRVISYGGRDAVWKGFTDMAEGVRRARARGIEIEWSVYGDCVLLSDNPITPFISLGFLKAEQLAVAYQNSQVLLSASWYESFPLFPLEGMASGLAVITTQAGTEAFAKHMETAWVVPPKDPQALCDALIELAEKSDLRVSLGAAAMKEAKNHTWVPAVQRMERILQGLLQ